MKCAICQGSGQLAHDFSFIRLYHCQGCGVIFSGRNQRAIRTDDWGEETDELTNYYWRQFEIKDRLSLQLLEKLKIGPPGKVLEIGCAMGTFLAKMRQGGWQVEGCEPSAALCQIAKDKFGLRLVQSEFHSTLFKPEEFQLVVMSDVLEHLEQPVLFLKEAWKVIKPGGYLMIRVPFWESLISQLCLLAYYKSFKRFATGVIMLTQADYNYHHWFYFTKATLKRLMEQIGGKVIWLATEGTMITEGFFRRKEFQHLSGITRKLLEVGVRGVLRLEAWLDKQGELVMVVKK